MNEDTKENIIAAIIVLILAVGAGWWIYNHLYSTPTPVQENRVSIELGAAPEIGNGSVTVVIFSDFECPYCGAFIRSEFPTIKKDLIDTGKIRFVFKQFPLTEVHPRAELAAEASLCAYDQNKFWEYHDILYANQDKLEVGQLEGYAKQLGLNTAQFKSCVESGQHKDDVARERTQGEKIGVTGTPTFFFNGRRVVGAISAADFESEVAKEQK